MSEEQGVQDQAPEFENSDFGVDPANFEDQPAEAPEAEDSEGQAVSDDEQALTAEAETVQEEMIELAKGLSLKTGDKLTAEHINQLKRGVYREADYTRKTQELAQVRNQANEVLQARDAIMSNPQALRQFVNDDHILKAFHPNELLVHGLQAAGIPPDIWNKFLSEYQETYGNQPQSSDWQANPLARDVHSTRAEIQRLQSRLEGWEQNHTRAAQEREQHEMRMELQNEVKSAAQKFKDVTEEEILEAIAAGREGTAEQIAARISQRYASRISQRDKALLEAKKRQQSTATKGSSVPVLPKRPTTWDEASAAAASFLHGAQE